MIIINYLLGKRKKMKKILLLPVILSMLSGCSVSPITGERMATIKEDTNIQEALNIAGKPDSFETLPNGDKVYSYLARYISGWDNYMTNYYIIARNGKVIAIKSGQLIDGGVKIDRLNETMRNQNEARANEVWHESNVVQHESNQVLNNFNNHLFY